MEDLLSFAYRAFLQSALEHFHPAGRRYRQETHRPVTPVEEALRAECLQSRVDVGQELCFSPGIVLGFCGQSRELAQDVGMACELGRVPAEQIELVVTDTGFAAMIQHHGELRHRLYKLDDGVHLGVVHRDLEMESESAQQASPFDEGGAA